MKKILLLAISAASMAIVEDNLEGKVSYGTDGFQVTVGGSSMAPHRLGSYHFKAGSSIHIGIGGLGSDIEEYAIISINPKIKFGNNHALFTSIRASISEHKRELYKGIGYQRRFDPDSNTWLEFSVGVSEDQYTLEQKQEYGIGLRQYYFDYC